MRRVLLFLFFPREHLQCHRPRAARGLLNTRTLLKYVNRINNERKQKLCKLTNCIVIIYTRLESELKTCAHDVIRGRQVNFDRQRILRGKKFA